MLASPESFITVFELDASKVVKVATLGMQQFAEHPLSDHVKNHQLRTVIVAVLHHDAVLVIFLGGFDELPTILDCVSSGNFASGMLTVLHRSEHDRYVPLPGRRRVDKVQVFFFAHTNEVPRPIRVASRFREASFDNLPLPAFNLLGNDVANGRQPGTRDTQ